MAVTKTKKDEDEIPYDIGLYTSAEPIKLAHPIASTRARLTLEVNKEGIFEVQDTGGHGFDFDLYVSKDKSSKVGKRAMKVKVISWGKDKEKMG